MAHIAVMVRKNGVAECLALLGGRGCWSTVIATLPSQNDDKKSETCSAGPARNRGEI